MRKYVFGFFVLLFSGVLAESEESGFVQHGTHEHGAALLNVALDGPDLVLEFISPAINIVGFEHAPSTNEQMELVEAAVIQLSDGEALFELSARAQCKRTSTIIESELAEEEEHLEESEIIEEDEHSGEEEEESHSEFHAVYELICKSPNHLKDIDLNNLFTVYPGIEDLDVQFVLPNSQGARELNKDNTRLQF